MNNVLKMVFTEYFEKSSFSGGGSETKSGKGSTLEYTYALRESVPLLLRSVGAKSILDAPCGDFNWLRKINLDDMIYIGMDIVREMIVLNSKKYGTDKRFFVEGDITSAPLPKVDVVLCRFFAIHVQYEHIFKFLRGFLESGSRYLLISNNRNEQNWDLGRVGGARRLNWAKAPFNFPPPQTELRDYVGGSPEGYLSLWQAKDISAAIRLAS